MCAAMIANGCPFDVSRPVGDRAGPWPRIGLRVGPRSGRETSERELVGEQCRSLSAVAASIYYAVGRIRVASGEIPQDYQTFALQSKAIAAAEEFRIQARQQLHNASRCDNSSDSYSSNHCEDGREKRRSGGRRRGEEQAYIDEQSMGSLPARTRAHLKECFETLKRQLPNMDDRKTSNLTILRGALRYIQSLKRREREYEHEMERLAREKIAAQQRLATLKKDMSLQLDYLDMSALLPEKDNETTTTASECGNYSDLDEDLDEKPRLQPSSVSPASSPKPALSFLCDVAAMARNEPIPKGKYNSPEAVSNALRPVYERLSDEKLLQRCTRGKTQNANEDLHSVIWGLSPKDKNASLFAIETAMADAVMHFNLGNKESS
ncbi:hypothetical protein HPB51_009125 [Rhipicephalus microplus]|uniref:Max-binding protein MNT n=1 Tax=Rhipicephalus microplus TaxID=6941 RepID=A0A9J6F0C5_RHIMP|nr:hypothetical protein HPB51_009125 [Rhipicephalus microplus]